MTVQNAPALTPAGRERGPVFRLLFVHQIDDYPDNGARTGYLAVAVAATIVLYYAYYTQFSITPTILRDFHMSFSFFVWVVIISNALGAFASLTAARTDRLGRSNVVIYGLLLIGLLVTFGVTNAGSKWTFTVLMCFIGLVEGAILVATPALVRDFSPQIGRASAMGFWAVGPVAGSLIATVVASITLSHFVDWQSQFYISGITALVTFVLALFFLKDLSPGVRDQLMVSTRDRALVEARARGVSESEVELATSHPWRQIVRWDLVGSAFGISVFLLVYYAAAAFFTIYFSVTFVNSNGTNYSISQVNALNKWFWIADIATLVIVGLLSDWLRVRKPFMIIGAIGAIVTLIVFLGYATHPHTGFDTLAGTSAVLAAFLAMPYAAWMAGYTETVEAKNPALVGTGLALWGWILRLVVAISSAFLPLVITSVNPIVDNQTAIKAVCLPHGGTTRCISAAQAAAEHITRPDTTIAYFVATQPKSVAFAETHQKLLAVLSPYASLLAKAGGNPPTLSAVAKLQQVLPKSAFAEALRLKTTLVKLVQPYGAQLDYLAAHQKQLGTLQAGQKNSPAQWQHWFWVDIAGMIVFIPTIWLTHGRWSPRRARRDEAEHSAAVDAELQRILTEGAGTPA